MKIGSSNMLIKGENLVVLKRLALMRRGGAIMNADGAPGVRLIYIDPPFSTGRVFRGAAGISAYDDTRSGGEFIEFMRERLLLLKELLSANGSIYVHLDWKMAHYIKIVMDEVFGRENFLNEIIWSYGGRGAKAMSRQFSRNHDVILLYRMEAHLFNRQFVKKRIPVKEARSMGLKRDPSGAWFKTAPRGDYTDKSIERLDAEGRVYRTRNGRIRIKYFFEEQGGCLLDERLVGDVWDDIPDAMHLAASEKTGYPTQKPEALLERIIGASSNEGDVVLDAFCGSGTTLVVADRLKRRWIGIDKGRLAVETARKRLERNREPCP
ncbi:MAG: site-specific DNA-methyltransferase [Deltaproteobacteria bacterium]|nr:site-specific DNA-methyltransferase [Deltaproteobacteria bacterium]